MTASGAISGWRGSGRRLVCLAPFLLVVACNVASGPSTSASSVPSASPTSPVGSTSPDAATAASDSPAPDATTADPTEYAPPAPTCPSPPEAAIVPDVIASIGAGDQILATRGSSTLSTCTTTAATEAIQGNPARGLVAHPGDRLTLSLPSGWQFLHSTGADRPVVGDATNIWPGADIADRPSRIEVPVPVRPGDSIASYHLDIVRVDGRVVGWLEIYVRVSVAA
jgi:hypothetical protein